MILEYFTIPVVELLSILLLKRYNYLTDLVEIEK